MHQAKTASEMQLEDFQRAVREFNAEESRRLFGDAPEGVTARSVVSAAAEGDAAAQVPPELKERESWWSRLRDNWADPAIAAVAASVIVWGGIGIVAYQRFAGPGNELRTELAAAKLAAAQAQAELATALSREQLATTTTAQQTQRIQARIDELNTQLADARSELKLWEQCSGTASPSGLLRIELPAASDGQQVALCVAPTEEIVAALEAGKSPSEAQVKGVVEQLLQSLRIPTNGQVEVKRSPPGDSPVGPSDPKHPLLVYRWNVGPRSFVDPQSPDGGSVIVFPDDDRFGTVIKDQ